MMVVVLRHVGTTVVLKELLKSGHEPVGLLILSTRNQVFGLAQQLSVG